MTNLVTTHATLAYEMPDSNALARESASAYATAEFLFIDSEESLALATKEMNACNKRLKQLDAARKSITKPMDEAKKAVMALFNPATEKFKGAIEIYKIGIAHYMAEQERLAAEAKAKAEAEAAEQRKALELAAESTEDESEREALQTVAASIVVSPDVKVVEKVKGATLKKKWKGEVVDLAAFLRYVADHPELHECVSVKQAALDRFISATGGAMQIPGVNANQEAIVACKG